MIKELIVVRNKIGETEVSLFFSLGLFLLSLCTPTQDRKSGKDFDRRNRKYDYYLDFLFAWKIKSEREEKGKTPRSSSQSASSIRRYNRLSQRERSLCLNKPQMTVQRRFESREASREHRHSFMQMSVKAERER